MHRPAHTHAVAFLPGVTERDHCIVHGRWLLYYTRPPLGDALADQARAARLACSRPTASRAQSPNRSGQQDGATSQRGAARRSQPQQPGAPAHTLALLFGMALAAPRARRLRKLPQNTELMRKASSSACACLRTSTLRPVRSPPAASRCSCSASASRAAKRLGAGCAAYSTRTCARRGHPGVRANLPYPFAPPPLMPRAAAAAPAPGAAPARALAARASAGRPCTKTRRGRNSCEAGPQPRPARRCVGAAAAAPRSFAAGGRAGRVWGGGKQLERQGRPTARTSCRTLSAVGALARRSISATSGPRPPSATSTCRPRARALGRQAPPHSRPRSHRVTTLAQLHTVSARTAAQRSCEGGRRRPVFLAA